MGCRGYALSVQPFVSTTINKLDSKGRVSVPAPFRQILAQQNTHGIYCFPSFVTPSLEAFGETLIAEFTERLNAFDPFFSEDHDAQAQAVLAASRLLPFDDEGRVRIPDEFLAHTAIKDRVTFVGMGRKFQIWDPENFAPIERERIARARASRTGGAS
ncbi:MAG: transcriptional regulator MraZ [Pseudomonadota bacterium]